MPVRAIRGAYTRRHAFTLSAWRHFESARLAALPKTANIDAAWLESGAIMAWRRWQATKSTAGGIGVIGVSNGVANSASNKHQRRGGGGVKIMAAKTHQYRK